MYLKIFTLKFDDELGRFRDEALEDFLRGKQVLEFRDWRFSRGTGLYWSIMVQWQPLGSQKSVPEVADKNYRKILRPEDEPLFETLRSWRNARAKEQGLAIYCLMNNMELAHIAWQRPRTLTTLIEIPGIGYKKCENYGNEILRHVGIEYFVTWNCRHIANVMMRSLIESVCRKAGYEPVLICTPEELLEVE